MNTYQKSATFLLRLIGTAALTLSTMGLIYYVYMYTRALNTQTPFIIDRNWPANLIWAISGLLLIIFSRPIGKLLGRGLD